MKTGILVLFLVSVGYSSIAQEFKGKRLNLVIEGHSVYATMKEDSLGVAQVREFFNYTDMLFTGKTKHYDRYLYTKTETYYRAGLALFRKPTIYKIVDGEFIKIKA